VNIRLRHEAGLQTAEAIDLFQDTKIHLPQDQLGFVIGLIRQGQHVRPVGTQGQFQKGACKAASFFDYCEHAAGCDIQPAESPAHHAQHFGHEPVIRIVQHSLIRRQNLVSVALSLQQPQANFFVIGTQHQDGIIQFTRHRQGPPVHTLLQDCIDIRRYVFSRRLDRQGYGAPFCVQRHIDIGIAVAVIPNFTGDRGHLNAFGLAGSFAVLRQFSGAGIHLFHKALLGRDMIDQVPFLGALTANAFSRRAENICQIAAHFTLFGQTGQATCTRQYAQQGHLWQADCAGTIINQENFITGQRHFIAAPCRHAITGRNEFQARMFRAVFNGVTGLIGELTEIHFPAMGGLAQHVDIRARTEHAIQAGRHNNRFNGWMFKPHAL